MKSVADGILKVRESSGKHAFAVTLDEGRAATGTPPCELMTIGVFGKEISGGLGIRKNDPLLTRLDKAISQLKTNGIFDEIQENWLHGSCDKSPTSGAVRTAAAVVDSIVLAFFLSAFYYTFCLALVYDFIWNAL